MRIIIKVLILALCMGQTQAQKIVDVSNYLELWNNDTK